MRNSASVTTVIIAIAALLAFAFLWPKQQPDARPLAVNVTIEQTAPGVVRLRYVLNRPAAALVFSELERGYRARNWTVETPGFQLESGEGDRLSRADGETFDRVSIIARADNVRIMKNYQPLAPYGEGGLLLYTGHFHPESEEGERIDASFTFLPAKGARAVAFGEREEMLEDWRSPSGHPAFVYMGPLEPVVTPEVMALVDDRAPSWIAREFSSLTPLVFAELADRFGYSLETKPNLFLAAPPAPDDGRLSYAGDALPGQFQVTLEGGAWREPSEKALGVFRHGTIHEAAHLWQAPARPKDDAVGEWITEGGADAVTAEIMTALSLWSADEAAADKARARRECAAGLRAGTLAGAKGRGDYRALYGCGQVIAETAAAADGTSVSAFWRAYMARARDEGGYDEAMFYALAAERAGDPTLAKALGYFVITPHADPAREIARLEAAAGAPLAPDGRR